MNSHEADRVTPPLFKENNVSRSSYSSCFLKNINFFLVSYVSDSPSNETNIEVKWPTLIENVYVARIYEFH